MWVTAAPEEAGSHRPLAAGTSWEAGRLTVGGCWGRVSPLTGTQRWGHLGGCSGTRRAGGTAVLTVPCPSLPRRNQAMRKKLILYFKRRNHARKQWVSRPRGLLEPGAVPATWGHPCWAPLGSAAASRVASGCGRKATGGQSQERAADQGRARPPLPSPWSSSPVRRPTLASQAAEG